MKFCFRAQDVSVELSGLEIEGSLALVWKKGYRRAATEPFPIKEELSPIDGSLSRTAIIAQDLAQICTLFKSTKTGSFESKTAKFALEHTDAATRRGKPTNAKLGVVTVDLATYASQEVSNTRVELSFLEGKVTLRMTLCSHWLQNVSADGYSDDSSVASFHTDADSEAGDSVRDEDSVRSGSTEASGGFGSGGRWVVGRSELNNSSFPPAVAPNTALSKFRRAGNAARRVGAFGGKNSRGTNGSLGNGAVVPGAARAPVAGGDCSTNPFGSASPQGAVGYAPMDAGARAQMAATRDAAIERMWANQEEKVRAAAETDDMQKEIRQLHDRLKQSYSEVKYLRQRIDHLSAENRVLRRDPRKGKRDAVIQQLEVELQSSRQERADMEEQLSAAFGAVIKELQTRVNTLTTERDRLLIGHELQSGKKVR